jgi:tryptophanyl-tRNA synthetase
VAETLTDYLEPMRRKRNELLARDVYVNDILKRGAAKAQTIASETMREVKTAMGL